MTCDRFDDRYLDKNGIDAHKVKEGFKCKPVGHYDIYNGETVTIKSKDNKKIVDTEMTPKEFIDTFGNDKNNNKERK